jgi:hypothetical protein
VNTKAPHIKSKHEDDDLAYKKAEIERINRNLKLTYRERLNVMLKLMQQSQMLKNAKIIKE